MDFFTTDVYGLTHLSPGSVERERILASVAMESDADYPEVYLTSGQGIVIGFRNGGILSWEENGQVLRTVSGVSQRKAAEAWTWLVEGELAALESLPWSTITTGDK